MKTIIIRSSASKWFVLESFLSHTSTRREMVDCTQNEDGTFTITWDQNDPQESIFNDWTEKDFINAIQDYLNTFQEPGEVDNNEETAEQISEYFFQDYDEVYKNYIQETNKETYGD